MTQLEKSPQNKVATVRNLLNSDAVRKQILAALPKHLTPERMIRVITTALTKTPKLADCDQTSLMSAIIQASELGLEPNTPLGLAYLIPYGREVQFQIGYRGLLELARRSGKIKLAVAEIVYSNDLFEIEYGTNRRIVHKPAMSDRGDKVGVYSVVQYEDGTSDFEYMTADDVEKIRKRSKSGDSGPWKTDTGEMWRKTPMRRHAKRWPLAPELAEKIVKDEYHDYGITPVGETVAKAVYITEQQRIALSALAKKNKVEIPDVLSQFGYNLLAEIPADQYDAFESAIINFHAVDAEAIDSSLVDLQTAIRERVAELGVDNLTNMLATKYADLDKMDKDSATALLEDLNAL